MSRVKVPAAVGTADDDALEFASGSEPDVYPDVPELEVAVLAFRSGARSARRRCP
jgi:hypothetical protein